MRPCVGFWSHIMPSPRAFPLEPPPAIANSEGLMKTCNWIKGLTAIALTICLSPIAAADPVRIFAAASLQGPLDDIATQWDQNSTISYGGSGTIARQISLGAPADVVILANETWADWLVDAGHVAGPARALMSNALVLVAPDGTPPFDHINSTTLRDALGDRRLAMGQHQSVPAGIYAKAWLDHIGAWPSLRPRLAETENVRAALALVARRETPLAVVYASDALASDKVAVVWAIPADQYPPILYHGLALTPEGRAFLDELTTRISVFTAAGFVGLA